MSCDEEPFILVTSKRHTSKNTKPNRPIFCKQLRNFKSYLPSAEDDETFEKAVELRKITDFTAKIEHSDYFRQSIDTLSTQTELPTITKIVCFGIGRIRHSSTSRYQLAYILALRSHLKVDSIQFHDPLLSHHDNDLLSTLNCELVSVNHEGKVALDATQKTLVFLPHCPKQLINNLLWKNWSANALPQIIFISNSFHSIVQQTPISCIDQDAGFIRRIDPYTTEFALRNSFEHKNVFNDIAIHFINTDNCEEKIFEICSEPSYDISELISATDQLSIQ